MTRSLEKRAYKLHVFSRNRDHVCNSQMGIQIWFHLWKWRICLFKNYLHSGLTKINPKTIRIWSKCSNECLKVARAREPTYISQIGNKKLFNIFKPIFPLLPNSLRLSLVKLGPKMTRSWEKGAQVLHVFSRNREHMYNSQMGIQIWFIFGNEEFIFSKITYIQEPTCISQISIKKLFYIFKPLIPLFLNSLQSGAGQTWS
jgi:hypothetical protein